MSEDEWEALCDGCGLCCLVKLEDEDTGELHYTRLTCKLLDIETCRCTDYENRQKKVPDCVRLDVGNVEEIECLPPSCAYRLVAEGLDLYWWHPLISGDRRSVDEAGICVRGRVKSEECVDEQALPDFLIEKPFADKN